MDPRDIDDVWRNLDRDHLAAVARRGPPPVFATISGAHLYGFASPDSDVDLRGAFLIDARSMLGLAAPEETMSIVANEPQPASSKVLELDKHLLYAYRIYLSGILLMRSGELDANLPSLNERFRLGPIEELVQRKREGAEKMRLEAAELEVHERHLDGLEAELKEAHDHSALPLEASTVAALDDLVVRARRETLR